MIQLMKNIASKLFRRFKPEMYTRDMIKFIKNRMGDKPLVGCEIGVYTGHNAENILRTLNIKKIYLVDPYTTYTDGDGVFSDRSPYERMAKKRLRKFRDKTEFIKAKSGDANTRIKEKLDFVYIDGNHSYDYVKDDIKKYYPLVKKGGVLGGHNYHSSFFDVVKVVNEFTNCTGYKLYGKKCDWWIVK